ncbi:MAG: alpha/beta fold hydrolase [Pseudomonadota bacterium]
MTQPIPTSDTVTIAGAAPLTGQLFLPTGAAQAAVVIHGATGIPQSYYRHFAHWLAHRKSVAVLTYDYRDFGASSVTPVARSRATMADWGLHDQQAARDWLSSRFPDAPIWVIGHSLGGFMLPYQKRHTHIARVITVASGPVHVRDHPWHYQVQARLFWYVHGPLLTRLLGYLPAKLSGLGADIPGPVYWQWRRWCTSRAFTDVDVGKSLPKADWRGPEAHVKFVAIADDQMIPPATVWRLMEAYPGCYKRQLTIRPKDYGLTRIGHLSAFARRNQAVWDDIVA